MLINLEPPAIKNYKGMLCSSSDPNWGLDSLIQELSAIEEKLRATSPYPTQLKLGSCTPPSGTPTTLFASATATPTVTNVEEEHLKKDAHDHKSKPFMLWAPLGDDEEESSESGNESEDGPHTALVKSGTRFSCADAYFSESECSDDELGRQTFSTNLMRKISLEEGILLELERENQLKVQEEVRKRVSKMEAELRSEYERTATAIMQIDKRAAARRDMDRQLDEQYQRKIAKELDYHLAIVQRNHEQRSHAEELRIRNDAALLEAKRREKVLEDEKLRQEKAKAEAQVLLEAAKLAEEKRKAAIEEAIKASEEASANNNNDLATIAINKDIAANDFIKQKSVLDNDGDGKNGVVLHNSGSDRNKNTETQGVTVIAAESAIKADSERLAKYNDATQMNDQLALNSNKESDACARQISKRMRQITGTVENVRAKSKELVSILTDIRCPPSIFMLTFAKAVVSFCENPSGGFEGTTYACGHVILLVVSQVPALMDVILAELHKVCMYTVPKHIQPSQTFAKTKNYRMIIGFREEGGRMETYEEYLKRMEAYMKLYAVLVQTETPGIHNTHGLKEGWAWLARFLNEIPATGLTVTALHAFLRMAGFALHRRYKSQFRKILEVISDTYLPPLKAQKSSNNTLRIVQRLEDYIKTEEFLKEPEGWRLQTHLASRDFI